MSCHERQCLDYMQLTVAVIFMQNILTRYFLIHFFPSIQAWWNNRSESGQFFICDSFSVCHFPSLLF